MSSFHIRTLRAFVWAVFTVIVTADIFFQEGFYEQDTLPGGASDERGEANLPFSTDTNRYSDGITSTGAFSSGSPRNPSYEGSIANYTDRYTYYTEYKKNAAEQGVAIYGNDGDQVKEAARLEIVSKPNFQDLPRPNKTFTVYAAIKWNPTNFAIQEGETYNITVFGDQFGTSSQFWYDGGLRVNAEGYSSYFDTISNCFVGMGRCRSHLKKRRRIPKANWMSLACAIGEYVRPLVQVQPGEEASTRWLPLNEATLEPTLFSVGKSVHFQAPFTGQLICFANDAHTLYWNNRGSIQVTIERTSWPPLSSNSTIYEESLLPSCDSAQVVYVNKGNNTYTTGRVVNGTFVAGTIKCNPKGGGSGWSEADVLAIGSTYGSGAPTSIFEDLSPIALEDDQT